MTKQDERLWVWEPDVGREGVDGVLSLWPGITIREGDKEDLVDFFALELGIDPLFVGTVTTLPNVEHRDMEDPPTGGRHDFFFFVKDEDVNKFAVRRLMHGMRWCQDVFFNEQEDIYPIEFRNEYPWPPTQSGGEEE